MSEATLQALDRLAEKTERSRSWLAVKAIEDYIALNAWQIAKISRESRPRIAANSLTTTMSPG